MPPTKFNIYSLPYHRNFPPLPPFLKRKPCWGSALLLVSLPGRTADMANSKLCKCIWFGSKFITRKHHLCLLSLFSSLSFDAVANDDKKMAQKPRHYQFVNWLSLNYHRYVIYTSNWAVSLYNTKNSTYHSPNAQLLEIIKFCGNQLWMVSC